MNHTEQMLHKNVIYLQWRHKTTNSRKKLDQKKETYENTSSMIKTKPSVCVTGDMRKIFHYSQNRALSVTRVGKTYKHFQMILNLKVASIAQQQQVGNAVPPVISRS